MEASSSVNMSAQSMLPSDGQDEAELARKTKDAALRKLIEDHGWLLVCDVRYELRIKSWRGYDWIEEKNMYVTAVTLEPKGEVSHE